MTAVALPSTRAQVAALVPHAGAMCLLDRAVALDAHGIVCETDTHRDPANPLAHDGRLGPWAAIEYAGQAMALHGALTAGAPHPSAAGAIASVRDVRTTVHRLDDIAGPLVVDARREAGEGAQVLARFEVRDVYARVLASGRLVVVLG